MRHKEVLDGRLKDLTHIRAIALSAIRRWFEDNGYLEVIPPTLTGATGSCEWFPNAISVEMVDELGNPRKVFLRQTAQLHLEPMTVAHNRVYTIGQSFRYERQVTSRHLWEFTLVEFEGRDFGLTGLMDQLESMFKAVFKAVIEKNGNGYRPNLADYIEKPFSRLSYDEGIEVLRENGVTIRYGEDFTSHDEQILVSLTGGAPLFLTEYPSDPRPKQGGVIKFFSMERTKRNGNGFKCKESKDEITVCCDLLLPNVGETVGGAVRVGNPELIRKQFKESLMFEHIKQIGLDPEKEFNWYFETILDDNTQSAGCGIGFERLIQFITRAQSIKECVEFPRSPDYVTP
jgi:asparaginyl-tRNA synthetase